MVTSSIPGEGKTTTAINLAISIAQTGKRVLLLDCDLRKGNIGTILNKKGQSTSGLSELLIGIADNEKSVYKQPIYGFSYILAGTKPPNPVELLGSNRMKILLEKLKQRYDCVICDTAPVLELADATAFSKYCDGVLLVVRHNYALKEDVKKTKSSLVAVGANILGTVVTRYDLKEDLERTYSKSEYYGYYE